MNRLLGQKKIVFLSSCYTLFFLFVLFLAYTNRLPLEWLAQLPNYDKIGHVILYGMASYLGHQLLERKHIQRAGITLPIFPAFFTLFTLTEELIQGFSPYRTLDAGDMVCSLTGIACGYWLAQSAKGKPASPNTND